MSIFIEQSYLSECFKGLSAKALSFSEIVFEDCLFEDCDFSHSAFINSKFIDCEFKQCNLSLCDISQTQFIDINFVACKLVGIDWTRAYWPNLSLGSPIKFTECTLNDSSFFGLSLKALVLAECKVHHVDFRQGDFNHANFSYSDFSESLFNKTDLHHADFTEASQYLINIHYNIVNGAIFSRYQALNLLEGLDITLID